MRILKTLHTEEQSRRALAHRYGQGSAGSVWFQDYLAASPKAQSQGLGTQLIQFQKETIWNNSECPIVLQTYAPRARAFYRRNKFEEIGWGTNGTPEWWYVLNQGQSITKGNDARALGLNSVDLEPQAQSTCVALDGMVGMVLVILVVLIAMPMMAPIAAFSVIFRWLSSRCASDIVDKKSD